MTASEIIQKYVSFFEKRGHKRIPNASLVPENDPTTLFTSSGMQPLVPYLLGEPHPQGKRLVNVQNCFRAQDIEEVGDNRHTTFFRMLGNWSLGDYFKKEQIPWFFEFLTKELKLSPKNLYATVFAGDRKSKKIDNGISKPFGQDLESIKIWKEQFAKCGIAAKELELGNSTFASTIGMQDARIFMYDALKNWWSRSGTPDKMPVGEPGGPDSEVFYEFTDVEHDKKYGKFCHPNCDCGRFLEIGNSVFMEYKKIDKKTFEELPNKNVDFGGGLERLAAAINNNPDIFTTDLYSNIIKTIEEYSGGTYSNPNHQKSIRVIADHLKAATYMIASGVRPSNKEREYILRRLMRRAAVKMHQLKGGLTPIPGFEAICEEVLITEENISQGVLDRARDRETIFQVVEEEMEKFGNSLDRGLKIFEGYQDSQLNELNAFTLYQSYGFPFEVSEELFKQKGKKLDKKKFDTILEAHKNLSRTASSRMFKGGLADHSEKTIMGHTATHLMHQAIRDVLGTHVHQTGSNITTERVRFDFNYDKKLTDEEIKKVQDLVNKKIKENLMVHFEMMPLKNAKEIGAIGLFDEKYQDNVKVYFIGGPSRSEYYSVEFCGGPHVDFTSRLKRFKIIKQENIGKGQRRLYSIVG